MTTPPPFELRSSHASGVLIVEVVGELDMATAPQLADAAETATDTTRRVVLDLSQVSFLDSSGLNALVRARRTLADRGIALRVVSPSDRSVQRVLEITHLNDELSVVASLAAALE